MVAAAIERARAGDRPTVEQRPYRPYGAAEALFYSHDRELIVDGPAGTGKSRAWLEKLHLCAVKYPGMRGLIVRKTRSSLTQSAMVTFEQKVLPVRSGIRLHHESQEYRYPNGSVLVVGGLGDAEEKTKIMSTEYDLIFVQEAREVEEGEWEDLTTRLRNNVMPYQQIGGDTNPDRPTHWIIRRAGQGKLRLLHSRHEDNPTITLEYLATLDALSGARLQRLRHGRWVQAEGVVYEDYDASVHLLSRDQVTIEPQWPRFVTIDFGYVNPFVAQWWAEGRDGAFFRYREIYFSHRLVEDHARQIKALSGHERIIRVYCDHDAEDRATLEKHTGWRTLPAYKDIERGIQAVTARLRPLRNGRRRLYLLRDSLVERDAWLDEQHLPANTEEEFDAYIWPQGVTSKNRPPSELPVDKNNHGMDAMRYLVATRDLTGDDARGLATMIRQGQTVTVVPGSAPRDENPMLEWLRNAR